MFGDGSDDRFAARLSRRRGEAEPRVPVDLAVLCATMADDARDRGGDVRYNGPDHLERACPAGSAQAGAGQSGRERRPSWRARDDRRCGAPKGDRSILRSRTTAPAFPPNRSGTVLQPFVRLDPARARDTLGLGLGLSIVARAVETEGGTLTCRTGQRRLARRNPPAAHLKRFRPPAATIPYTQCAARSKTRSLILSLTLAVVRAGRSKTS
jgi:hypothetical protein